MSHGIVKCKICENVIWNCGCIGSHEVKYITCKDCQKIIDKSTGVKMHELYPNGVPFYDIPTSVLEVIFDDENSDDIIDDLHQWLDDKFWVCHQRGVDEEKRKHE